MGLKDCCDGFGFTSSSGGMASSPSRTGRVAPGSEDTSTHLWSQAIYVAACGGDDFRNVFVLEVVRLVRRPVVEVAGEDRTFELVALMKRNDSVVVIKCVP